MTAATRRQCGRFLQSACGRQQGSYSIIVFARYAGEEHGLLGGTSRANAMSVRGASSTLNLLATMDMIGWSAGSTLGADLDTSPAFVEVRRGGGGGRALDHIFADGVDLP